MCASHLKVPAHKATVASEVRDPMPPVSQAQLLSVLQLPLRGRYQGRCHSISIEVMDPSQRMTRWTLSKVGWSYCIDSSWTPSCPAAASTLAPASSNACLWCSVSVQSTGFSDSSSSANLAAWCPAPASWTPPQTVGRQRQFPLSIPWFVPWIFGSLFGSRMNAWPTLSPRLSDQLNLSWDWW